MQEFNFFFKLPQINDVCCQILFILKQLFTEALEGGTMEGFFKLISYYQTQSEINYCGIASLAMVFNALAIDPGRTWKGT